MEPHEIRDSLVKYWNQNFSTCPTNYVGYDFHASKLKNPHVEFLVGFGDSYSVICGDGVKTRDTGLISILVRVPLLTGRNKQGDREALAIASQARSLMERVRIDDSIITRAGRIVNIGEADGYWNVSVRVPFLET